MDRIQKQLDFIKEIEKLKTIKRQNLTLDNGRQENSAEHSWHLALMASILIEYQSNKNINLLKVIKMLLIHDLAEIYTGDTFLYDENDKEKTYKDEEQSLKKLVSKLPEDQANEIMELWYEFEKRDSETAKFAASIDGLQPLINNVVTAPKNHNPHGLKVENVKIKKKFIKQFSPKLWTIVEEMIEESQKKGLYT